MLGITNLRLLRNFLLHEKVFRTLTFTFYVLAVPMLLPSVFASLTSWHLRPTHDVALLLLRGIGVVDMFAFYSMWVQVIPLIGRDGLLPAQQLMGKMRSDAARWTADFPFSVAFPTLTWWVGASDAALLWLCRVGFLAGAWLMLFPAALPPLPLLASFLCYQTLKTMGQSFMQLQWDALVTETNFLGIVLSSAVMFPPVTIDGVVSLPISCALGVGLLRFLTFRLMFSSGVVKLSSMCPAWDSLMAMTYHYWTQPLPNRFSWLFDGLPVGFHQFEVVLTLFMELATPIGMLMCWPLRVVGFLADFALMAAIFVSGSYGFFQLLTVVISMSLLDDFMLPTPLRSAASLAADEAVVQGSFELSLHWVDLVLLPMGMFYMAVSIPTMANLSRGRVSYPKSLEFPYRCAVCLGLTSPYGLFASMTTSRPEILLEGSNDKKEWKPYIFKFKPVDLDEPTPSASLAPPAFFHMPRLDWDMWFLALGHWRRKPWFVVLLSKLLCNDPTVLSLLRKNPFPDKPPKFLRSFKCYYYFNNAGAVHLPADVAAKLRRLRTAEKRAAAVSSETAPLAPPAGRRDDGASDVSDVSDGSDGRGGPGAAWDRVVERPAQPASAQPPHPQNHDNEDDCDSHIEVGKYWIRVRDHVFFPTIENSASSE